MSPLTINRIKNAEKVRLQEKDDKHVIQILENKTWVVVYSNESRKICEDAIKKASSKVILG